MTGMRAVDVMGFAGGFDAGVRQAGFDVIAKREPSAFGGFGVAAVEANIPGVQVEVSEPEFWSIVKAEYVFGNPPCSGFSMLSTINTAESKTGKMVDGVRVDQRGIDSPDNKWMHDLISYTAGVKPQVAVFESVPGGGKLGAPLMRELWQELRDQSGLDYHMTDVFMNAALVGGDVIRPRYFWVAHLRPFGVDLPRQTPRTLMEVIGDLGEAEVLDDPDWGHVTNGSRSAERISKTIEWFRESGKDWAQGSRLPVNLAAFMESQKVGYPEWWYRTDGKVLSHAVSDNMYAPFRWRANQPMGVVTGGFMDRAIHPTAPRLFTYREGARFMGLPDDWTLFPYVDGKRDAWLGKGIPVASGRWITTWAGASIEGAPGEYAGVLLEPKHRVIDVTSKVKVDEIDKTGGVDAAWWAPTEREVRYSIPFTGRPKVYGTRVASAPTPPRRPSATPPRTPSERPKAAPVSARGPITRIAPEVVQGVIDSLGLSRKEAAEALGCSPSRIAEMTTHTRPGSWLNSERWVDVQADLRDYVPAPA